jgi:hypothetical protein
LCLSVRRMRTLRRSISLSGGINSLFMRLFCRRNRLCSGLSASVTAPVVPEENHQGMDGQRDGLKRQRYRARRAGRKPSGDGRPARCRSR